MKTIKIAHLYYDLMNLYGENGNIKCLTKYLEQQDFKVEISLLSKDDDIDFKSYDLFYIGSGNMESFTITLEDLKKYKEELKQTIEEKFFIITGNALNLFGTTYQSKKNSIACLDLLNYSSKDHRKRIVREQLYKTDLINEEVIGFENRSSSLIDVKETSLFYEKESNKKEGIIHNNFYGTYLLGPLLIRNPYFTNYIVKQICETFDQEFHEVLDHFELEAYENYKNQILIETK